MTSAAALAVMDVMHDEGLVARANTLGDTVVARLHAMAAREDLRPIGHIRALGSMIGFDLLAARGSDEVDPAAANAVVQKAHKLGLVVLGCGSLREAIRLLFPLTIPDEHLEEGMQLLEQALVPSA